MEINLLDSIVYYIFVGIRKIKSLYRRYERRYEQVLMIKTAKKIKGKPKVGTKSSFISQKT